MVTRLHIFIFKFKVFSLDFQIKGVFSKKMFQLYNLVINNT